MPWIARTGRELSRFFINSIHNFPIFLSLSQASPFPVIYQFKLNIFLSCYHHQHIKNAKTTTQTKIQITNNQKKKNQILAMQAFLLPDLTIPPKFKRPKKREKININIEIIHSSNQSKFKRKKQRRLRKEARVPTTPLRNEPRRDAILQPHVRRRLRRGDGR